MKDTKQLLLDALSKESDVVIATAYSYAKNLTLYGVDVAEKWNNEVENTRNLERAYNKGYNEGYRNALKDYEVKI